MEGQPPPINPEARQWALFLHLSLLAGYLIPLAGLVAPIIIWQLKKSDLPSLDAHGKVVANWVISQLIYAAICGLLIFVLIGFPLLIVLAVLGVIFPIIGAVKASDGEVWTYPLSIKFFT